MIFLRSLAFHSLAIRIIFISLLSFLYCLSSPTLANDIVIEIEDARIDAPLSQESANGFMHIINFSEEKTIVLLGASTLSAKKIALQPKQTISLEAGSAINLTQDEMYLLLEDLQTPFQEGSIIPVTLHFQHGDETINMIVVKPGTHLHHDESGNSFEHNNH